MARPTILPYLMNGHYFIFKRGLCSGILIDAADINHHSGDSGSGDVALDAGGLRFPEDLQITLYLQSIDDGKLRSVMEWISFPFGGLPALATIIVIAVLRWWRASKRAGVMVLLAGLLSTINYLIKWVINRPRPTSDLVHVFSVETGNGFPSGHAVFTTLVLGMLIYFVAVTMQKSFLRALTLVGLVGLIFLVGVSRVYLGVHWASDVVGGYLVGTSFLLVLIWFYQQWKIRSPVTKM